MNLLLASASQSRAALLRNAGIDIEARAAGVDEEAAKASLRADGMKVADQAMRLAELKALKLSALDDRFVIGADQMLNCGGEAFDKPADMSAAARSLGALQGREHTLETAIVIARADQIVWRHLAQPKLTMRPLSADQIDTYLAEAGEGVLSTVGAYMLEGLGARLFERIEGDYFSILGLPLLPLLQHLRLTGALVW